MDAKGVIPFDPGLVSQSVNYHGHNLLKQLVSDNAAQIHTIKLQDIDYKIFQSRNVELRNLGAGRTQEIIGFIASKSEQLLVEQHKLPKSEQTEDQDYEDRYKHQYPFEYFLNVDKNTRIQEFMNIVQVGDVIYAEVVNSFENTSYTSLKFIAYDRGKHRFLSDIKASDMKIILKNEDTVVSKADEDKMGRWMCGTRLRVEVLSVHVVNAIPCLVVGTKGVTLKASEKEDVKLGKILIKDLPQILSVTPNPSVRFLSDCMEKMDTYKNPQCIRAMASEINIDMHWYPSLLSFFKTELPDKERAVSLRKAQMCKWAHKSVADGVTYFKKGQHEEAFQCLNKALQIDPDNVEAYVAKGALLANLGRYEKAIEDFDKSLTLNPEHLNARKYMCETLVELGKQKEENDDLKEAEKCYSRCLELNEHHPVAREALNIVSRKLGPESSLMKLIKLENIKRENEYIADLLQLEQDQNKKKVIEENPIPTITSKMPFVESVKSEQVEEEEEERSGMSGGEGSLSPLSRKMANQENLWSHPPPSRPIPTITTTVIQSIVPPNNRIDVKMFNNNRPPNNWPRVVMANPPPRPIPPQARVQPNFEDQNYKARVEEFLKALETRSVVERKRSKSGSTGEEKRREMPKDDKKSRSSSSGSSSSSSDDDSRKKKKRRSRSSSNTSSGSSSRSSSSSSSSSSDDNEKRKKRKGSKKSKKSKSKKKKKNVKKKEKEKKQKERKETELHADTAVSDFGDLEEKLMAYYKKIEAMGTTQEESKTPEKKPKKKACLSPQIEAKRSEGEKFEMNKGNMNSVSKLKLHTHPAFLEDSEEEVPPKDAKFPRQLNKKPPEEKPKKQPSPLPVKKCKSKSRSSTRSKSKDRDKKISKSRSRSTSGGRRSRSRGRRSRSRDRRSRSRGRRSRSRGRRSRSRGRRSRSRGRRSRSRGRRSRSRGRSRSRSLKRRRGSSSSYSRSRSRSRGKGYNYRSRSRSRRREYHHSRSDERSRPRVKSPGYFRNKPYYSSKVPEYNKLEISSVKEFRKHTVEIAKQQIFQHLSGNVKIDAERKKYENRKGGEKSALSLDPSKRFGKWANERDGTSSSSKPSTHNV